MALLVISYKNKHFWIPLLSVTIFEVTKLKTLIHNLAIVVRLCKQLHILRGCPTTQKKQIVLMCDFSLLQLWCNETFTPLGLLDLEDGTDRLFLNNGNYLPVLHNNSEEWKYHTVINVKLQFVHQTNKLQTWNYSVFGLYSLYSFHLASW